MNRKEIGQWIDQNYERFNFNGRTIHEIVASFPAELLQVCRCPADLEQLLNMQYRIPPITERW